MKKIATDPATADAWKVLGKEQKDQVERVVEWHLQQRYFQGYLSAAKASKSEAERALKKNPAAKRWRQHLSDAKMAEAAAEVKPVAGRMPINAEHAGQRFPTAQVPAKYRDKGVRFTKSGFPDFDPHAVALPNGQKSVMIKYQGSRTADFKPQGTGQIRPVVDRSNPASRSRTSDVYTRSSQSCKSVCSFVR